MEYLINIVVPVYNVEKYVERCIKSIINQTYKNLRIILVDDGSTDSSLQICDEYAKKDNRIHIIHKENGGVSSARNAGIEYAQKSGGGYIAFVDSDDFIDENMYSTLIEIAKDHDADIVECGYIRINGTKIINKNNTGKIHIYSGKKACEEVFFGPQIWEGISALIWDKLYRISLFENMRFQLVSVSEDTTLTPKLLYLSRKVVKIDKNLYNYVFTEGSFSASPWDIKRLDAIDARRSIAEFFKENREEILYKYNKSIYMSTLTNGYYECRKRSYDKKLKKKAKELKLVIESEYKEIKQHRDLISNDLRLFMISSNLWFFAHKLYKYIKYKRGRRNGHSKKSSDC